MLQPRVTRVAPARLVWFALSIVYVIWGSTYLAIRVAVETIPPLLMAGVRFVLAGALMFAWDTWTAGRRTPAAKSMRADARRQTLRQWGAAVLIGGLLLLGGNGGVVWGEAHHVASGVSALIFATLPMWMALLTFVLYRERLGPAVIAGLALGFAGTALLVSGVSGASGGVLPPLIVLGGAVSWSLGSVLTRWAPLPARQTRSTAMQMLSGGALLLGVGLASGEATGFHPERVSTASWLAVAYLLAIGSLVAFTAYTWLLSNARISLVSTYAYVNPIVALFLGWAFASEHVTPRTFVASAIVIAAVAIVVSARSRTGSTSQRQHAGERASGEHP